MKNFIKSLKRKNVLMCILIILGSVFLLNFLSVKEGFPNRSLSPFARSLRLPHMQGPPRLPSLFHNHDVSREKRKRGHAPPMF